ncbi:MAG: glutathione S-transferase [Robiginitomaculum sp.]|nr:MAG: glutathione S-transferase [Robiginitomaculum sp.]
MGLTLYHARRTRSLRPLWLMEEMGLKYELKSLAFKMGATGGDEFAQINPLQKVPALIDDGQTLLESIAIMEYLMGRYGPTDLCCTPQDPEYGPYLQWLQAGESHFGMYMSLFIGHRLLLPKEQRNPDIAKWAATNLQSACALLGDRLKHPDSILDRGFSAADISVGYVLFVIDMIGALEEVAPQTVVQYWNALKERPAWKRAISL